MEFQNFFLADIMFFSVLLELCVRLGVPISVARTLCTRLDPLGNSEGDEDTVSVFLPLSTFSTDFRTNFLQRGDVLTAAQGSFSGLFLNISGAGNCAPPGNAPRVVTPPVYRVEDAVEEDVEEEIDLDEPRMSWMICLYGLVSESVFREFGWNSAAEYAAYVSNPSNIVLIIRNGQVEPVLFPEYEHVSVPFSALPECIIVDLQRHGAYFENNDKFLINIVRAERSG